MKTNSIITFIGGGVLALAIVFIPKAFDRPSEPSSEGSSGHAAASAKTQHLEGGAPSVSGTPSQAAPGMPPAVYHPVGTPRPYSPSVTVAPSATGQISSASAPRVKDTTSMRAGSQTTRSNPSSVSQGRSSSPTGNSNFYTSPAAESSELAVNVPRGATVPAAIATEPDATASEQAVNKLDDISEDFLDNVTGGPVTSNTSGTPNTQGTTPGATSNPGSTPAPDVWRDATFEANERYRSIYGVEAFNRWTTEAAKQAIKDR